MTVPEGVPHGKTGTYGNHKCRCDECREATRRYANEIRARRFAMRVLIDGRLVAAHLPYKSHGTPGAYSNYGCRCVACAAEIQRYDDYQSGMRGSSQHPESEIDHRWGRAVLRHGEIEVQVCDRLAPGAFPITIVWNTR